MFQGGRIQKREIKHLGSGGLSTVGKKKSAIRGGGEGVGGKWVKGGDSVGSKHELQPGRES